MGLYLTLGIDPRGVKKEEDTYFLAYSRLELNQSSALFDAINQHCKPKLIPKGTKVLWYESDGLKEITVDAYGRALTYLTAEELGKVSLPDNTSDWNKAVFEFIKVLPPKVMIILWWH